MGLQICSLVCHSYLEDLLLTFSYMCILPGKTKNLWRVDTLTPSAWISSLVHTMLQLLVTFGALILCQFNIYSWKSCCCLSLNFILPLEQVLVMTNFCTVTKAEQETFRSSLCCSPLFWRLWWLLELFLMMGLQPLYHEIWSGGVGLFTEVSQHRERTRTGTCGDDLALPEEELANLFPTALFKILCSYIVWEWDWISPSDKPSHFSLSLLPSRDI